MCVIVFSKILGRVPCVVLYLRQGFCVLHEGMEGAACVERGVLSVALYLCVETFQRRVCAVLCVVAVQEAILHKIQILS